MASCLRDIAQSAMFQLVLRDHGGCDDEECSLRQLIEDNEQEEAIIWWHMSGAACPKFERISRRFLEVANG